MIPVTAPSIPAADADHFWFLDGHCRVQLAAACNVGGLSMLELRLPFDSAPPFHIHQDQDEVLHVLEGAIRVRLASQTRPLEAGELIHLPKGVPHGFRVVSPEGARLMVTTIGAGFEGMVRALARPADAVRLPEEGITPAMIASLEAACDAARITLIGPPIP